MGTYVKILTTWHEKRKSLFLKIFLGRILLSSCWLWIIYYKIQQYRHLNKDTPWTCRGGECQVQLKWTFWLLKYGRIKIRSSWNYVSHVLTTCTVQNIVTFCSGGLSWLTSISTTHFSVWLGEIYHPDKSQYHKISNKN